MTKREIDFPEQIYSELQDRKERTKISIAAQVKLAVAEYVGELD